MDTVTAPNAAKLPERRVSILCSIDNHIYCDKAILGDRPMHCGCTCHTEAVTDSSFLSFAYSFYLVGGALNMLFDEGLKQARLLALIEDAQGTVNFQGLSSQEVLARFSGTLSHSYWSQAETLADFGFTREEASSQK